MVLPRPALLQDQLLLRKRRVPWCLAVAQERRGQPTRTQMTPPTDTDPLHIIAGTATTEGQGARAARTLRKPCEGEKARERGKQEGTTRGHQHTAGGGTPRAVYGSPLTSSPARAASHSKCERDTRPVRRSAQAGCSGARPAGQPCPLPEEHGSIRQAKAGPWDAAREGREQPWATARTLCPPHTWEASLTRRQGDLARVHVAGRHSEASDRTKRGRSMPWERLPAGTINTEEP
jgi:hypothetical protein